jgi:hypothetical protein
MPDREGEYLFYFGHAKKPFYVVDMLRFTVGKDGYKTEAIYLEEYNQDEISMWWKLPLPNIGFSSLI